MASIGISDVVTVSILRENLYEEVDDENDNNYYHFIIMNKSHGRQKLTSAKN